MIDSSHITLLISSLSSPPSLTSSSNNGTGCPKNNCLDLIRRKFYLSTIRRRQGVNCWHFLPIMMPSHAYKMIRSKLCCSLLTECLLSQQVFHLHIFNIVASIISLKKRYIFCKARLLKQIAGHLLHRIMHKDMTTFLLSLSPGNIPLKIGACDLNKVWQLRHGATFSIHFFA